MFLYAPAVYLRICKAAYASNTLDELVCFSALYETSKSITAGLPASSVLGFYETLAESRVATVHERAKRVVALIQKVVPEVVRTPGPYPVDVGMSLFVNAARAVMFASQREDTARGMMLDVADKLLTDATVLVLGDPTVEDSRPVQVSLMLPPGDLG